MSRVYVLYVSTDEKFHACYRCVEYALNAFGARFRHISIRDMRVQILRDVASVTCPKRDCAPVARGT